MRIDFSLRDSDGTDHDLAFTADSQASGHDLAALLRQSFAGRGYHGRLWCAGNELDLAAPIARCGLRSGQLISVTAPSQPQSLHVAFQARIVAGPDAGCTCDVADGRVTLGRASDCDLRLTDPEVSRHHLALSPTSSGVDVEDLGSTHGSSRPGELLAPRTPTAPLQSRTTAATPPRPSAVTTLGTGTASAAHTGIAGAVPCARLPLGEMLLLGDSLVSVVTPGIPAAAVRSVDDGRLLVHRPPRQQAPTATAPIEMPTSPHADTLQRVQWITALVPAAGGVGLAYFLHAPQFLLFALLSPVVVLASALGDRVHWRRSRRRDAVVYRKHAAAAEAEIALRLSQEWHERHRAQPGAPYLADVASAPGERLWERHRNDPDLLQVRLGLARLESSTQVRRLCELTAAGYLDNVPLNVDLASGPIGIVAPTDIARGIGAWVLCQLATLCAPTDVSLALLLSESAQPHWQWGRWLPHLGDGVALGPENHRRLAIELAQLLTDRQSSGPNRLPTTGSLPRWQGRWIVLILDRAAELTCLPELEDVLRHGADYGITAICLDTHSRHLPAACRSIATVSGETGNRILVQGRFGPDPVSATADRVTTSWAADLARNLAPLITAGDEAGSLPPSCRLLDLLGFGGLSPGSPELVASVCARWRTSNKRASTVLGQTSDGQLVVDLVRDGPHALVAGTTGAGKSELLQSWVAGLAASYSPELITFILIDYKGGAAFADCAQLPHTAGVVTDLDPYLVRRALASLDSELRRRESLFAEAGAPDLDEYRTRRPHAPIPRLVLVVDEFAALAEELPEFVAGLIAISQRGRSLGIHLILATQRPNGVVSAEIRANVALRIALRVTSPAESADIIEATGAATIDRRYPGRAYAQVGSELTMFQTARIGGRPPRRREQPFALTALDPWCRLPAIGTDSTDDGDSDLRALVAALGETARLNNCRPVHRPWLEPLPATIPAQSVAARPPTVAAQPAVSVLARATCTIGVIDLPRQQLQAPGTVDLANASAVVFAGSARSGRTSALLTLAAAAAGHLSPAELHIHTIDCTNGGLNQLTLLPHTGTTTSNDLGAAYRLLCRLEQACTERSAELDDWGANSVAEALAAGQPVPLWLLLVDGWEAFVAASEAQDSGRSVEQLINLIRRAPAAGLTVAITGERAVLMPRLSSAVGTKYVLRFNDRADYAHAGIPTNAVPEHCPAGRAISAADHNEVQFTHLGSEPTRRQRELALRSIAERWHENEATPASLGPIRIRPLPDYIARADLAPMPGLFTLGVVGDEAEPIAIDLFSGAGRLLIAGPGRSGRSSALLTVFQEACRLRIRVWVVGSHRSPLVRTAHGYDCPVLTSEMDASQSLTLRPEQQRGIVLVDDCECLNETTLGDSLAAWARNAPPEFAIAATGRNDELALTYRGIGAEMRRARCLLLLQPSPIDGELAGLRLPRTKPTLLPGRGLLISDPAWGRPQPTEPIQVAMPCRSPE